MKLLIGYILSFLLLLVGNVAHGAAVADYLQTIRVVEAWKTVRDNPDIVIAVLDTGIDRAHPDLKGNVLPGVNLVQVDKPLVDGNGHGTGVAGILAAVDRGSGVKGILDVAKLLPIKVLDDQGTGESGLLAKGIRLAVDKGSKIILLSLGDPIYSRELEQAVQYAEQHGVLIVSAAGNDGGRVTYPGAFPTVLTVGAVDRQNRVVSYSNRGPELSLVAPGDRIKTTSVKGGYAERSGTSFAAPQVAGIAALVLKENPSLAPREVRQLLKATARDLGAAGWDINTGYGLVDGAKAIQNARHGLLDPFGSQVAPLSYMEQVAATLGKGEAAHSYRVTLPYDGWFQFQVDQKGLQVELTDSAGQKFSGNQALSVRVKKGTVTVKVTPSSGPRGVTYWITTGFKIGEDAYEPNDSREKASALPVSSLFRWTGNFHREGDADWYSLALPYSGKGELEVTVDSLRIDPILMIEQEGKWKTEVDQGSVGNGQKEEWSGLVSPGKLFVGIREYYGNAAASEYVAQFRYSPDPSPYFKDIATHWARKEIELMASKKVLSGYKDGTFQPNRTVTRAEVAAVLSQVLKVGGGGKVDLMDLPATHWSYSAVAGLVQKGIIVPVGRRVSPDQPITRGDLAIWLGKAKYGSKPPGGGGKSPAFVDLPPSHAAYPFVRRLWQDGLIAGVTDTQFGPNGLATRAQLAVLLKQIWY